MENEQTTSGLFFQNMYVLNDEIAFLESEFNQIFIKIHML